MSRSCSQVRDTNSESSLLLPATIFLFLGNGRTDIRTYRIKSKIMGSGEKEKEKEMIQKSYFDVLGLCCFSEVALVERILTSLAGVKDVSVIVPSKTVIVVHDSLLISASQIAKALNQAKLEANVKVNGGEVSHRKKWPRPYVVACGVLLALSFLKYVYPPLQWLAVGAVAVGIWPIAMRALAAARNLTLDVNILVLIAVIGTLALKDCLEAGTIVFLFTIAEWLQSRASHKATAVMSSLMSSAPQKAIIGETGEEVNVEDVKLNTILAVKAGQAIPIDGIVVEGSCEVDEKVLTGEAFPVAKQKDSTVWAGTINLNGYISMKTTALADECVVAKMAKLVEEAQGKRPRIQRSIDECAKYYTPAVVLVSAGLAVVPIVLKVHDQKHWFHLALVVLVSACPCALILATPVATFCALSRAAIGGLLIKGGDCIETLAKIKATAFDKTGTITRGEFVMTGFQSLSNATSTKELLYWVSSLESKSSHPIADAVVHYGRSQSVEPKPDIVREFQIFPGEGICGKIDGREIYVGNRKFGHRAGCVTAPEIESILEDGRTIGFVYSDRIAIGTFNLSDTCRSGAVDAIKDLKSMGIRTTMLTGDSNAAAMHAQTQLGNAFDEVHAELLPQEKARIIEECKNSAGPTAMVGDGINDAPALATADVGISMGVSGSALAAETGHMILMSNDIKKIPKAIKLAKRTQRKVVENIVFSVSTKTVIVAVAIAGHPIVWLAVLADVLTCLLVILNSMMLLRQGRQHGTGSCSKSHLHAHDHHKGGCHGSSVSHHHAYDDDKSCRHGSLRLRHHCHGDEMSSCHESSRSHHHHHHHHHTHDVKQSCSRSSMPRHCHDDNKGSCSMIIDHTAARCEPGRCSSQEISSSTCKTGKKDIRYSKKFTCTIKGCSSQGLEAAGTTTSIQCCESVACCNINDSCSNMDGHNQCHLLSVPRASCQEEECRDLEGQDGCLRRDDCGLSEGRCSDKCSIGEHIEPKPICCSGHGEEQINHEITEDNNIVRASCSHVGFFSSSKSACLHSTGSGGAHVHPRADKHACGSDAVGNRKLSGCSRSFREECCRIHGHVHGNFAAGFGGSSLPEIVTE